MTKTRLLIAASAVLLLVLLFGLPWLSPARGVERAWARLIDGIEDNDFGDVAAVLHDDYKDGWGLAKAEVLSLGQTMRRQFLLCTIEYRPHRVELSGDKRRATVSSVVRFGGTPGSPVAQAIIQYSNQTGRPTSFEWVRGSWKPWDWKLVRIDNPEATPGVRRLQREAGNFSNLMPQ